MSISIIVPTYKEVDNLRPLTEAVHRAMSTVSDAYEMVFVDDNSADGSEDLVKALAAEGFPVRMIVRTTERGLSSAVIRGFEEATGDYLFCMDADLSHPPESLPEMLKTLVDDGADMVIGSRWTAGGRTEEGWGLFRYLNSKVATALAFPFTTAKDPMSGFFGMPRRVWERRDALSPVGYKIGLEIIVKCRCRDIREVPILFRNRLHGESKLSLREQINYVKHVKRLADYKFRLLSRFLQFCLVGGVGAVIDIGVYYLLLTLALAMHPARAIAILIAMSCNFLFNRRLTFSFSRTGNFVTQYLRFVATCAVGAVVNWAVSVGLAQSGSWFGAHHIWAAGVGIIAGTGFNFLFSVLWVFKRKQPQDAPNPASDQSSATAELDTAGVAER